MNSLPRSPELQAALQQAALLLQSGQHVPARDVLARVLRAEPDSLVARGMVARSLVATRDFAQAVRAAKAWLARQPDSVEAHVLLAVALAGQGRHGEAAAALRHALDQAPADPAVLSAVAQSTTLARTFLERGRARDAESVLAEIAVSGFAGGTVLKLYGHALMALGRKRDAVAAFRRWLQVEPESRDAALVLAAVLADNGGAVEAEGLARTTIAHAGASADAAFVLARSLLEQGRFDEAEHEFRNVVRDKPEHQTAQANLMELVWMRTGDLQESSRAIDAVMRDRPELSGLRITKARLLTSARRQVESLAVLDAGLAISPHDPALLRAASTVALEFDGARAYTYAMQLCRVAPSDYAGRVALGNASLATGRARAALQLADELHRANPTDGQALAMQADALRMLGDDRYRELLDYGHLVRAEALDVPPGWTSLADYLADLVPDLQRAHVLNAHPIGNSLRGGSQIQLVASESSDASIRAFPRAIDGPIRRYLAALGKGEDAMRRRQAAHYAISGMWSVRLRPNGFHTNHYHPEGWISSACYLHLPPAISARGEGWLKFGEPAFPTSPALGPEYFLKPEPGLLALFPSYMWHGTVPFAGDERSVRLTIAFDVVPAS